MLSDAHVLKDGEGKAGTCPRSPQRLASNRTNGWRNKILVSYPRPLQRQAHAVLRLLLNALGLCFSLVTGLFAVDFSLRYPVPALDRWVYPFGDLDGQRSVAPTWASFDIRFDTRDGQFLLGWDTADQLATNAPATYYLIQRVRVTVEHTPVPAQASFVYDPTYDSYRTYLTNNLAMPDTDPGRPVELYGVGFRGGYTAATFLEASPFGHITNSINNPTNVAIGIRNAFAADFAADGTLEDISNNVGQAVDPFEVNPFAVGHTTEVLPGAEVPDGTRFNFDLDLTNPLILGYVQRALQEGHFRVMLSALHRARAAAGGIGVGGGVYPNWVTKENLLGNPAGLEVDGVFITDADTDADGLPDDWERAVFGDLVQTGDGDFDGDGVSNADEFHAGTDQKDAGSRLRITGAFIGPDRMARLRFPFAANRKYRIGMADELGQWQPAVGAFQYSGSGEAEWTAATSSSALAQFFRIEVVKD